jgi:hypothetical protein
VGFVGREGELSPTCQGDEAPLAGHDHPFVAAIPAEQATWDTERTNAEIGAELDISPKTAGVHVSNIVRKLGVSGRVQAAALAERAGLLHPGSP